MVSFSNYTVKFSAQPIGTTSSATILTLTNIGSTALNVTGLSLTGSEFLQTNNCPSTLAVAANCSIDVTFTPTSSGNHLGSISLTDNAYDSPQDVQLVGNIPVPALKVIFSAGEDFGGEAIGVVSNPEPVILCRIRGRDRSRLPTFQLWATSLKQITVSGCSRSTRRIAR